MGGRTGGLAPLSESPKEGRWIAPPKEPKWVLSVLIQVMATAAVYCLILVPLQRSVTGVLKFFLIVAVFALFQLALIAFYWVGQRRSTASRRRGGIARDGVVADEFEAEVSILVKGKFLGADQGVLWFSDGLMGFSGAATSFVLAAWDVEYRPMGRMATMDEGAIPAGALELVDAPVYAHLMIRSLRTDKTELRKRIERFERESASADAERCWPPLTPYAEAAPSLEAAR